MLLVKSLLLVAGLAASPAVVELSPTPEPSPRTWDLSYEQGHGCTNVEALQGILQIEDMFGKESEAAIRAWEDAPDDVCGYVIYSGTQFEASKSLGDVRQIAGYTFPGYSDNAAFKRFFREDPPPETLVYMRDTIPK